MLFKKSKQDKHSDLDVAWFLIYCAERYKYTCTKFIRNKSQKVRVSHTILDSCINGAFDQLFTDLIKRKKYTKKKLFEMAADYANRKNMDLDDAQILNDFINKLGV